MLKRTALFSAHQKLGARLVDFGGWEMPVQYSSIVEEHLAVRQAAGIFDISHMGELTVSGPAACDFLNHVLTNDVSKLAEGQGHYTLLCNERGGVVDAVSVFRLSEEVYLLVINAARIEADVAWMKSQAGAFPRKDRLIVNDASENYSAVAVQGPKVTGFIGNCLQGQSQSGVRDVHVTELKKNEIGVFEFQGANVFASRTGYTGEDGFEIIGRADSIQTLWDELLAAGKPHGCLPCGLGARDTLRTEMCYPLYGHELDEETTPLEAGLGFFVAMDKSEFVGKSALVKQKQEGIRKKLVAFTMTGKTPPPRPHYDIWSTGEGYSKVGQVVSGTQSPSLNLGIGMGYVTPDLAKPKTELFIDVRGRRFPALAVSRPIYKKS